MARIGMVRADLESARVLLADLESKSQEFYDFMDGQERYFRRPTTASVDAWRLANGITAVTSATIIAATVPVGGPLDVSTATINAIDASILALGASAKVDLQEILAPHFFETEIFQLSFRSGDVGFFSSSAFVYAGVTGAAIEVVEDDGVTAYHLP